MAKLTINDVELEFDVFEAENAEMYQKGLEKIIALSDKLKGEKDLSKAIRTQCKAVFEFIDSLFGSGTHNKIFGESVNLKACVQAFNDINKAISADKEELEQLMKLK